MAEAAIKISQLSKSFGSTAALKGVSFVVQPGDIFGFLGPNGAGKSTTIRCLMDFIRPSSGSVQIFGRDAQVDSVAIKRNVSYLSSENGLYPSWTSRDHIEFVASVRRLKPANAYKLAKRLDLDVSRPVHHLSTGNRQKLGLVLALLPNPKLLVLDEPTRGLDPLLQQEFQGLLRDYQAGGGTVFMSSHNLPEVELICNKFAIIRAGKLVADETLDSLKSKGRHNIRATLKQPISQMALRTAGATDIIAGPVTTLSVKGELDPMLGLLARAGVIDLEITHSTLEELFMELYE